jgi:hypothetical protein
VEKAIAMRGVVSDIADDHTPETFRGHYAHGTTLHVISGQVINHAQQSWLDAALADPTTERNDRDTEERRGGPVALDEEAQRELGSSGVLETLTGLTREQAEQLRAGALDMGVTSCRDPFDSPYSKQGDLCVVAPLRCLECTNAFILPSNLP